MEIPTREQRIEDYFINPPRRKTRLGVFTYAPLRTNYFLMKHLLDRRIIDKNRTFLDAGSGDGRVAIQVASVFDINSIGIEEDEILIKESQKYQRYFVNNGLIKSEKIRFIHGDFSSDKIYNKIPIPFSQVGCVYNYVNNQEEAAKMIHENSPPETRFIFHDFVSEPFFFKGLELIASFGILERNGQFKEIVHFPNQEQKEFGRFFYIYKKIS